MFKGSTTNPKVLTACAMAMIALYVFFSSFHLRDHFMDDETWEFYASRQLVEEGRALTVTGETNVFHPHGYYYVLGAVFKVFGAHEVSARMVGLLATILCFCVLLRMAFLLAGGLDLLTVFLLGVLYLLSPAVIQGSLIITADTAVHHLVITLFLLYVIERFPLRTIDWLVLPVLFAATLWIKFVTPCLILAGITAFFLLRREWWTAFRSAAIVGGAGLLLFAGSWALYCRAIDASFFAMFEYIFDVAGSRAVVPSVKAKLLWLARQGVVVILWLGIPYTFLILRSVWNRRWQERISPLVGLIATCGVVLGLVYTLVAGSSYGYPRYHFTMLPLWAVVITLYGRTALREARLGRGFVAGFTLVALAYFFFVAGDPLYAINFELKMAMLGFADLDPGSPTQVAGKLILLAIPFVAVVLVGLLWRAPARTTAFLVCLTIAGGLALNGIQARADYHTSLSYGEKGTREMHAHVTGRLRPGAAVVAAKDTVYHVVDRDYMPDWRWEDREYLLNRLDNPWTQFLIMGINHNTITQLRRMRTDPEFRAILEREYAPHRIGSYFLWERRNPSGGPRRE